MGPQSPPGRTLAAIWSPGHKSPPGRTIMGIPKQQLKIHKQSKHDETKYSCDHCDYKTTYRSSLNFLKQSKHEWIINYCHLCGYEAAGKEVQKRHKQSKHEGCQYRCDMRDYKSSFRQQIKIHNRMWSLWLPQKDSLRRPINLKIKILTKPSFRISSKIQLHNLYKTSAAKCWTYSSFKISPRFESICDYVHPRTP